MARKRNSKPEESEASKAKSPSAGEISSTHGAVAGVSAATLGASVGEAPAQGTAVDGIKWDYEADLVVIGSGASGLPCAIRARDAGLRVLVIDQNFDVGGKMLHSGGADLARRRRPGAVARHRGRRRQGRVHQDPAAAQAAGASTEDADFLFRDITDWSVLDVAAQAPYRYNDRDLHRAWADNCYGTRQFLIDNYVRFTRIHGTHPAGGISRAEARDRLPHARRQDGHQERNRHAAGRGH